MAKDRKRLSTVPAPIRFLFGATKEQRYESMGLVFILPWFIGVCWFFVVPFIQAMFFIFFKVEASANGLVYTYAGLDIIDQVFFVDPENGRAIWESLGTTFVDSILIVAFSLIVAMLLNKPFRGRAFCRALMALPILVSSGVLMTVFQQDLFRSSVELNSQATIFQGAVLEDTLIKLGMKTEWVSAMSNQVAAILDLIWQSGIQILLFVGGIQSIPRSYMEVAEVEGATSWQSFWKITFPMITPFLLLNLIYAIVDSFTSASNPVMTEIADYFGTVNYSAATTLSVAYFLVVLIIVGLATLIISRRVFYIEK